MSVKLNIQGVKISITANNQLTSWIEHDYSYYISNHLNGVDLQFNLIVDKYDYSQLPYLEATTYHDDYIVYDNKNIRIIDFIAGGASIYDTKNKTIVIYCSDVDQLYDIFYLSFESLLGEQLDQRGFHRIHCLSLDVSGQATVLLLPPGAGKTTLALQFSGSSDIKVLSEDMVLFKKGILYGLHFRWGTRDQSYIGQGRVMIRQKHHNKILINTKSFSLAGQSCPARIILGHRVMSTTSKIEKISKFRLLLPMFKSMVLGLELQQSLAYFLLRHHKDVFSKFRFGFGRLKALLHIIGASQAYLFYIGHSTANNFQELDNFLKKEKT